MRPLPSSHKTWSKRGHPKPTKQARIVCRRCRKTPMHKKKSTYFCLRCGVYIVLNFENKMIELPKG